MVQSSGSWLECDLLEYCLIQVMDCKRLVWLPFSNLFVYVVVLVYSRPYTVETPVAATHLTPDFPPVNVTFPPTASIATIPYTT